MNLYSFSNGIIAQKENGCNHYNHFFIYDILRNYEPVCHSLVALSLYHY